MTPILLFLLRTTVCASALEPPWQDLALTIARDFGTSSDTVTLCRVRVVNHGSHTWPGRRIRFEAEALEGETVMERARGRFGLSLGPREVLETLIGFSGRYDRFTVRPLTKDSERPGEPGHGKRSGVRKRPGRRKR